MGVESVVEVIKKIIINTLKALYDIIATPFRIYYSAPLWAQFLVCVLLLLILCGILYWFYKSLHDYRAYKGYD